MFPGRCITDFKLPQPVAKVIGIGTVTVYTSSYVKKKQTLYLLNIFN